ncbi:sulfatase-like hydrolase/transferase [Novosphingobium sp. PP1Y]|uniref:sulfatase-like hydrolase/transferase n=1 Tax=Novosphingobium sp. PP1Y TaxID=702113 RepID=UPI00020EE683|nr:sulfatase-like hydrolase/transferase [Novosphingobium sp. PP1Y]CCA89887.1 conserved hypothetical protein [Novosphingobium sp. PP1Y]
MESPLRKLSALPLFPFLVPMPAFLLVWIRNITRVSYDMALPTVAFLFATSAIVLLAVRYWIKNWPKASLAAGVWLAVLLYLPPVLGLISTNEWFSLGGIVLGLLLAWDMVRQLPSEDARLLKANGLATLICGLSVAVVAGGLATQQVKAEAGRPDPQDSFEHFSGSVGPNSPDVWHIVMDRYAGQETLAENFGFDNRDFVNALRQRGFSVADHAHSNYQITPLSLASTLNASHLRPYTEKLGSPVDYVPLFRAIDHSAAFNFFKAHGYQFTFAGGWADVTGSNSLADNLIEFRQLRELPRTLLEQSVPGVLGKMMHLPYTDGRNDQCEREKYKFEQLTELSQSSEKKFIFAHFLLPHPPYVLNPDGTCKSIKDARRLGRRESYVDQVKYSNDQLIKLIDSILSGVRPATIILQADEGPYPAKYAADETEFPLRQLPSENYLTDTPDVRKEKTSIILAIRHSDGVVTPSLKSPLNIYPEVLHHSFSSEVTRSDDNIYMFPTYLNYNELSEVSSDNFSVAH